MNRLVALLIASLALLPAAAFATPSPSPALSGILAPPPKSDYVEAGATNSTLLEGQFDAKTFVTKTQAPNAVEAEQTLTHDGFVDGYWRTWVQSGTQHVLIEVAIAFTGNEGAKRWLGASELAAKSDNSYQKSLSVTGIDSYFGAHYLYAVNHSVGEEFAFVKGNDYFDLVFVSGKDDLGTSAATQATAQYKSAPDFTIPKSQWPETTKSSTAYQVGFFLGPVILLALIAGVILLVVGLVLRSRRRRPAFVGAVPGAMAGAVPGATPAAAVQMSPDGAFWWDGQTWRDAQHEVPPMAQRSPDGAFWWDGQKWRAVS
jgi:hypothetical protein